MNKISIPNDIMLGEVSRMLAEGKSVTIPTKGSSMMPFIVGERDSVELVWSEKYEVGDIVLSQISPGHWVLHRLIYVGKDNVILKGDGNLKSTERCRMSDITGKAIKIIRPGKEMDCSTEKFAARSLFWRRRSIVFRKIYLAIYRRVI